MPYRMHPQRAFRRKTAAKRIQSAWRAKKNFRTRVKRVITSVEPYKYHILTTIDPTTQREAPLPVSEDATNLLAISNIPWNTQNLPHNRSSTKCLAKNLRLRMTIRANSDTFSRVRLMVVRSKRSNNDTPVEGFANAPTTPNLFRFAPPIAGPGQIPAMAVNAVPNTRFADVVWDHTFTLGTYSAEADVDASGNFAIAGNVPHFSSLHVEKFIKLNKTLKYNAVEDATSGTEYPFAPYNNMSYFLLAVSNSTTSPEPLVYASACLSYKDLD